MDNSSTIDSTRSDLTAGLDLGDKYSQICLVDQRAEVIEEARVRTTAEVLRQRFSALEPCLVVMEAGTHSPWISRLLESLGHRCLIANPAVLSNKARKKNDKVDAEKLARWGRADPQMLHPITHRSEDMQQDMAVLLGRRSLVEARTKLINTVRGLVKAYGVRLPKCDARYFAAKAQASVPEGLKPAIDPLLRSIAQLSQEVREMDKRVEALAGQKYAQDTGSMQQIRGIGGLIATAFVLVIRKPDRFQKSRDVGPYLGLTRRQDKSGASDPELRISKAGNQYLRQLLVNGAHYVLGPFGPDCDLRRWGLEKAKGGKRAKKRAVVAVARKLAVLMHRLWVTGEVYEPLGRRRWLPDTGNFGMETSSPAVVEFSSSSRSARGASASSEVPDLDFATEMDLQRARD